MTAWQHTRKGRIEGKVVSEDNPDSEFISILLDEDVKGYVTEWSAGTVITVRKEFLTEVDE